MNEEKTQLSLERFLNDLASSEVYIHNHGEMDTAKILNLLVEFSKLFKESSPYPDSNSRQCDADALYTRMATLLSLWLSTEDIQFTAPQLFEFVLCKPIVNAIFYASGFRGTGHLVNYLSSINEDGTSVILQNKLLGLLAVLHIDDVSLDFVKAAKKLQVNYYLALMMGWLNCSFALTESGENIRKILIDDSDLLLRVESNYRFIDGIANAWMQSSYFICDNKYALKKNINKMLSQYVERNFELKNKETKAVKKTVKPLLVIIHERLTAGHAMFRCYKHYFQELNEFFDVVSIVQSDLVDDSGRALFPRTLEIEDPTNFKKMIADINQLNPDLIFYPSLGMCRWTVLLANTRLAPIQVMACGHPDSSYSEVIDYIWSCELPKEGYSQLSEICLADNSIAFKNVPYPDVNFADYAKIHNPSEIINLAINCSKMKLNSNFLSVLDRIIKQLGEKVRLHFFPSMKGYEYDFIKQGLLKLFPTATVYPVMPYADFMKALSDCDISLAPFPFGNANSTVDALLLGIPVVAMYGSAPYAVTDQLVMQSVGLESYVCKNEQDYVEMTSKLVDDPNYLTEMKETIAQAQVADKIFKNMSIDTNVSFAKLLYGVFNNHVSIKQSKKKVISFKDIASFDSKNRGI